MNVKWSLSSNPASAPVRCCSTLRPPVPLAELWGLGGHFLTEVSHLPTLRRQELRELRLLQKEEHRNQNQLSRKHELQLEQMHKRFEQEVNVSAGKDGPR